eukprot:5708913-Prymnesium_polylepis.1
MYDINQPQSAKEDMRGALPSVRIAMMRAPLIGMVHSGSFAPSAQLEALRANTARACTTLMSNGQALVRAFAALMVRHRMSSLAVAVVAGALVGALFALMGAFTRQRQGSGRRRRDSTAGPEPEVQNAWAAAEAARTEVARASAQAASDSFLREARAEASLLEAALVEAETEAAARRQAEEVEARK